MSIYYFVIENFFILLQQQKESIRNAERLPTEL